MPDLILLDIMMPEMDGYETCRRLKRDVSAKNIDVIFVSAKKDLASIITGYEVGGSDYFILNSTCISLLIKNMPKELQPRKRLSHNLTIFLEGVNARVNTLELEAKVSAVSL